MTDYLYDSYLTPLDALAFDIASTPSETDQEAAAAELALWSNAQFTFDVKPGQGLYDDEKNNNNVTELKTTCTAQDNDPITYEKLVNYLDYELPQQQQQQQQQQVKPATATTATTSPTLLSRPLAAAAMPALAPAGVMPQGSRQLLPKPTMMDPLQLASLLTTPMNMLNHHHHQTQASYLIPSPVVTCPPSPTKKSRKRSTSSTAGVKRDRDEDGAADAADATTTTDEALLAEEDKRKRNTAASARFRIKKKLREQAMEQTVRDMTKKSDFLQGRVNDLELEVKWLRSLLTEKELNVKNN